MTYMTKREAADYCRVSTRSLERWVAAGILKPLYAGRRWLFTPNLLDCCLRSMRRLADVS